MNLRFVTPRWSAEAFAVGNLAFLAADVYIAHSVNAFERPQEWIPVAFSVAAPLLLLVGFFARRLERPLGFIVGFASVAVGVAGLVFHLQSHFFEEQTLKNLVYTAPFVAPLAYAGIGMLVILDRMVDAETLEWPQWVIVLALGGFGGNFVLSLADHAQNGFFNRVEWVAVVASALAVAFLLLVVLRPGDLHLHAAAWIVLALQVIVGVLGFVLHVRADYLRTAPRVWDRFLYGAPVFAPLLFPNLAVLAAIGLWAMRDKIGTPSARSISPRHPQVVL
jgi:hypothetical protein